jgi:hypothetical protein
MRRAEAYFRGVPALPPASQNEVPEAARLLAVVTLKNAVGASWRKTLASRGACAA